MQHYVIMGVSGVGKSLIGNMLAEYLQLPFAEGDDFHSSDNVLKMTQGVPLTDTDRWPWLDAMATDMHRRTSSSVYSCSALKKSYRQRLTDHCKCQIQFIYLKAELEVIEKRLRERQGHYMPPSLLQSQFDALEEPKTAMIISAALSPEEIIEAIVTELNEVELNQNMSLGKKQFGIIGLGVMGKSLARNFASRGTSLALYNRYVEGVEEKVAQTFINTYAELQDAIGLEDLDELLNALEVPRKILIMVKAGPALDTIIEKLKPKLSQGDIIIDGGNSHYLDTARRQQILEASGIHYIGCGVSGGEEGALKGPSIMPGGNVDAYKLIAPFLEKIAAKDKDGKPCCAHIGDGGAGHFVKMVHNGIEYGEMQLLAEVYSIMRFGLKRSPQLISDELEMWNEGPLSSYLLEITTHILRRKEGDNFLIDLILDKAGNKGTGSWTTIAAAELGVSISVITNALFARYISAYKDERLEASDYYSSENSQIIEDLSIAQIRNAYEVARIINHHQGIQLIAEASRHYSWNLDLSSVARIWTNGCIIRSTLMQQLISILKTGSNLLTAELVVNTFQSQSEDLFTLTAEAIKSRHSIPCFSAASNYLSAYTNAQSTANIIQAQRDYFGAHRYLRKDDPEGPTHHTEWLEE